MGHKARTKKEACKGVASLVPVRMTESESKLPASRSMMLEIVFGDGRALRLPAQLDEEKIARLVSILDR